MEWHMAPKTPNWAARPFWISTLRARSRASGSVIWVVNGYPPGMRPGAPSYPPGRSWGPPVYWLAGMAMVSAIPPKRRIWARPRGGVLAKAPKPVPMLENGTSPARSIVPGNVMPSSWTSIPTKASMAIRPCLISTARRRAKPSVSSRRPRGSKRSSGPGSTPRPSGDRGSPFKAVEVLACDGKESRRRKGR